MYITDMSAFYVLTGQVSYRMTYNQSAHIRVRSGIYHFVRRVPADLQQHYRSDRVSISLRTKSARAASRSAVSICQRLDDYWHGLRLQKMDVPALHLVIDDDADVLDNSPTMMEAVETYLRLKAEADGILQWCLEGARLYQQQDLQPTTSMVEELEEYRRKYDPVAEFIRECVRAEGGAIFRSVADLVSSARKYMMREDMLLPNEACLLYTSPSPRDS